MDDKVNVDRVNEKDYVEVLSGVVALPDTMRCSLNTFASRIRLQILEEQGKIIPDMCLIALLCQLPTTKAVGLHLALVGLTLKAFVLRPDAKKIGAAQSSVSVWVRDIKLSEHQKEILANRVPAGLRRGWETMMKRAVERRKKYQEEGKLTAKRKNILHMAGCMLYWAEGHKCSNQLDFVNSDPEMIQFFLVFLRKCYNLKNEKITIIVSCYDDLLPVAEIEKFWLRTANVSRDRLGKTTVNNVSVYGQKKRCGKLKYGTCKIRVNNYKIIQSIYGAIQEYVGFNRKKWLFDAR